MNIILEGPEGKRFIEAGTPYKKKPGEKIVGSGSAVNLTEDLNKLEKLATEKGIGVGDLVAKLTKVFGIKPCAKCEERRQVLNKLHLYGWKIGLDKVK